MPERLCKCGCGQSLAGRRDDVSYFDGRCRQRAYRERVKAAALAVGAPASITLRTLNAENTTGPRNGDGPTPRRRVRRAPRAGVSTYFPPGQAEAALEHMPDLPELADARATLSAAIERRDRRVKRGT